MLYRHYLLLLKEAIVMPKSVWKNLQEKKNIVLTTYCNLFTNWVLL